MSLVERALRRSGTEGLIDGKPAVGPLVRTAVEDEDDNLVQVRAWTVAPDLGRNGAKVEIEGESYVISALADSSDLGDTWILRHETGA